MTSDYDYNMKEMLTNTLFDNFFLHVSSIGKPKFAKAEKMHRRTMKKCLKMHLNEKKSLSFHKCGSNPLASNSLSRCLVNLGMSQSEVKFSVRQNVARKI